MSLNYQYIHQKLLEIMEKENNEKIYLFLDFDGVINIYIDFDEMSDDLDHLADNECIARINKLCLEYDLDVVLSTSWRFAGLDYCHQYLLENGFSEKIKVVGITQIDYLMPREEEIIYYLLEHDDFKGFIILDDIYMENLNYYLVYTNENEGFSEDKYLEAVRLLNSFLE